MAITEAFTATETVTTTDWSLTTDTAGPDAQTDDGVYQCYLDLSALAAGDSFQFRVWEKVVSAGTQRRVLSVAFNGVQSDPHWVSPSLILMHGWDMTIIKTAGTDRSITASIRKIA
jgi:hypothetical protein